MKQGKVRAIAICVIRRSGDIFVFEGYDVTKAETFYRPLGGAIEFGERSPQTILRELREEVDAEITHLKYMATLENIFTHNGQHGHEIILVYEGDFADASMYEKGQITGQEDNGEPFKALWVPVADFVKGSAILYPDGLLELILKASGDYDL